MHMVYECGGLKMIELPTQKVEIRKGEVVFGSANTESNSLTDNVESGGHVASWSVSKGSEVKISIEAVGYAKNGQMSFLTGVSRENFRDALSKLLFGILLISYWCSGIPFTAGEIKKRILDSIKKDDPIEFFPYSQLTYDPYLIKNCHDAWEEANNSGMTDIVIKVDDRIVL